MTIKDQCSQVLQKFLNAYGDMCDDFGLSASKALYETTADQLIQELPDTTHDLPYRLSDRRIQNVYHRIRARSPESTKGAVSLALHRMLLICRKAGILEGRVTISQRIRREEIPIHSSDAFALLDDFIAIREWLLNRIQRVPRSRKDLPQLVIASLIAINGVTLPSAPRKIGACKISMLHDEFGVPMLEIPASHLSSRNPPRIQYFLLPELLKLLQHLKGHGPWLFPQTWTPDRSKGKRNIPIRMNRWLNDLWNKVMPHERPKPNQWNITTFIQCSRLYFALHCPPVVAGFLSGRSTFAAYSGSTASVSHASSSAPTPIQVNQAPEPDERPESLALAQQIIEGIGSMLRQFERKRQNPGAKKEAAVRLAAILVAYEDTLNDIPVLHHLSAWMLDELLGDGGKRKMGTFQSMWQFIPSILINELGAADPANLDDGEWLRLAEYVIQENTYASATRSKIKNHLKSFHTWLVGKHPETGRINWRVGALRIAGERPETLFPTLGEFDRLFQAAAKLPPQNALRLQAALTLAFFGGLRAEEITLISKMDMDETTIQVRVWWSKTRKGRRRVPLGLLAPRIYIEPVLVLRDQCRLTDSFLLTPESKDPMNPGTLSKQVLRLVTQNLPEIRRMTLHAFRHGFASWLMIRYFALIEPGLLTTTDPSGRPWIPDPDHRIFHPAEQKKLVRVFNGRVAGERYEQDPASFISKPEHFAMISRMIGHATRDTTARTYIHSMPWIARYFIHQLARRATARRAERATTFPHETRP